MKKVIAIVDDEKDLNELMKSYLEKEGYEVRSYYTYEEAEAHVYDDDVHLWMLDIMLDEKSGFDLFEIIKNQNSRISLVIQWLKTPSAQCRGPGLIPGQGPKSRMSQ